MKARPSATGRTGKPLLDPPELDDKAGPIRDTDEKPGWIPGAFPSIFQHETGYPYNFTLAKPDLLTWGPHVMRSRGWAAQAHMAFIYFVDEYVPARQSSRCKEMVCQG